MEYSKIILMICLIITVLSLSIALIGSIFMFLSSEVSIALITAGAAPSIVAILSYYKKALSENVIKIATSAYKDISEIDETAKERYKENLLNYIDSSINDQVYENNNISLSEAKDIIS